MKILSIKTLALVTFFFLYGCEFTPDEVYLYKEAEWVNLKNSKFMVAKDSIEKDKNLVTFIAEDTSINESGRHQTLVIDCKKELIKIDQVFKNGVWEKSKSPQWNELKGDAVKSYVCQ